MVSLQSTRNREVHDARRRIWSGAFGNRTLRGHEARIRTYQDILIEKIDEFDGAGVDITKWFNLFSFDVMATLHSAHRLKCCTRAKNIGLSNYSMKA
jgi:tryprostatin B 6-hydroxylase